ncbi:hypothetical protein D0Z03_000536 [Geotrichum reessii]|nr:hypothetical protein D0Z03_000536 [Galactomyces reessii]
MRAIIQRVKSASVTVDGKIVSMCFTLFANTKKGAKPDFHSAAKGETAKSLYDLVLDKVSKGMPNGKEDIGDGVFGAMMDVALVNDGPVTITLDTEKKE